MPFFSFYTRSPGFKSKDSDDAASPNKINRTGKCSDNDMDADEEDEVMPGVATTINKTKRVLYRKRKHPSKSVSGN